MKKSREKVDNFKMRRTLILSKQLKQSPRVVIAILENAHFFM